MTSPRRVKRTAPSAPSMQAIIKRMMVARPVTFLVALAIAGNILLVGACFVGHRFTEQALQTSEEYQKFRDVALDLMSVSLQVRRYEKDFLHRKAPSDLDQFRKEITRALRLAGRLQLNPLAEDFHSSILQLEGYLQAHQEHFNKIAVAHEALGFTEEEGMRGRMRQMAHQLEVLMMDYPHLTTLLLRMRRNEKDFIIRQDEKYLDLMAERFEVWPQVLPQTPLRSENRVKIVKFLELYQQEFQSYAETVLRLQTEVQKLSKIYSAFSTTLENVLEETQEKSSSMQSLTRQHLDAIKVWVGVMALILIVLQGGCGIALMGRVKRI